MLRAETDGGLVLLDDVSRVEIGAANYVTSARFNTDPAAGMAITLAPGANALETARTIKDRMAEFANFFPKNVQHVIPYDTTPFVEISIKEVVKTLFAAIGLVFLVMLLFLQNLRATLIPTLAVPVVLLGTFGVLAVAGFSINTLTMLAMVLAIGLLVDDAIVVVENVERIMEEEGLPPREATHKSMGQITGAPVGIAMVLSAVFVPMAFFPGSTGVIYRQFAITIVSAMALSVVVAITLTPALCASLLKPKGHEAKRGPFAWFNTGFAALTNGYTGTVRWSVRRSVRVFVVHLALALGVALIFLRTPTGFLPEEDQGILFTLIQTPTGSTAERTSDVVARVEEYYLTQESGIVKSIFGVVGFSFSGRGQTMGLGFVQIRDWKKRTKPGQSVQALAGRAFGALSQIRDARVFPVVPPAVIELGNVSGFDFYLQARGGQSHAELVEARGRLLGAAAKSDLIASARPNGLQDAAQFNLDIDWRKAGAMGADPHRCRPAVANRLGRHLCERFPRSGPDQARLRTGRSRGARNAHRYRQMACSQCKRRSCAIFELRRR